MTTIKYPGVSVRLSDEDGNAFVIIGRVGAALKRANVPREEIDAFYESAQATTSYDALLQFVMATVETS